MNSISYWEEESFLRNYDVIIIGSGIVGLNAALTIKQREPLLRVIVLERGLLPSGASTKNAGFACFGSVSELIEQLAKSSEEELVRVVSMRWNGLKRMLENLGMDKVAYENNGGYELFSEKDSDLFENCVERMPYFNSLLKETIGQAEIFTRADDAISRFGFAGVKHLLLNRCEAQINTGKMMQALIHKVQSLGVSIWNGVDIQEIRREDKLLKIKAKSGLSFQTKKVIVCTNAFVRSLIPSLDVVPGRGQVVITKPIENLKIKGTFHYDKGFYYFRNVGDRVLLGGGRNIDFKAEETYEFGETEVVQNELMRLLREVILPGQDFEMDYKWSGIMGFGKELKPIVKETEPGIFCAVRCNGMGVAIGSLLGEQVAKLALEA